MFCATGGEGGRAGGGTGGRARLTPNKKNTNASTINNKRYFIT